MSTIIFNLQYFLKIYKHNFSEKPGRLRTNGLKRSETLRLYVPRIGVNFSNSDFFTEISPPIKILARIHCLLLPHMCMWLLGYMLMWDLRAYAIYSIFSYDYKFLQCQNKYFEKNNKKEVSQSPLDWVILTPNFKKVTDKFSPKQWRTILFKYF